MTADEMAEAKHKADMDDKMKAMIREIIFYAVLLFLLLIVINGQQDTNSYRQNFSIISLFNKNLNKDVSNAALQLDIFECKYFDEIRCIVYESTLATLLRHTVMNIMPPNCPQCVDMQLYICIGSRHTYDKDFFSGRMTC